MLEKNLGEYLNIQNRNTLEKQIIELYNLCPKVREYYNFRIDSEMGWDVLEEYKEMIRKEFLPKEGKINASYSNIINLIGEFQKLTDDSYYVAKLMFYYVNLGIQCTDLYGIMEEKIYLSIEATFSKLLKYILKYSLQDKFQHDIENMLNNICEIGFDFKDSMNRIYSKYIVHI